MEEMSPDMFEYSNQKINVSEEYSKVNGNNNKLTIISDIKVLEISGDRNFIRGRKNSFVQKLIVSGNNNLGHNLRLCNLVLNGNDNELKINNISGLLSDNGLNNKHDAEIIGGERISKGKKMGRDNPAIDRVNIQKIRKIRGGIHKIRVKDQGKYVKRRVSEELELENFVRKISQLDGVEGRSYEITMSNGNIGELGMQSGEYTSIGGYNDDMDDCQFFTDLNNRIIDQFSTHSLFI